MVVFVQIFLEAIRKAAYRRRRRESVDFPATDALVDTTYESEISDTTSLLASGASVSGFCALVAGQTDNKEPRHGEGVIRGIDYFFFLLLYLSHLEGLYVCGCQISDRMITACTECVRYEKAPHLRSCEEHCEVHDPLNMNLDNYPDEGEELCS